MVRVTNLHHGFRQGDHGTSALNRTIAARKKKPYKIIMEAVTQEKKKLRSITTYQADAPRGYTFVPLGNPVLTEYCKERCRLRNITAHIVTAQSKGTGSRSRVGLQNDTQRIDTKPIDTQRIDTQRIGHHFPNEIIEQACNVLGFIYRKGVFVKDSRNYEDTRIARTLREYEEQIRLNGHTPTDRNTTDKIRSAIREVFPKIPESDMDGIVTHSFQEGTERVGNAKDLTLARRVQLAVGAYIRHQYTNYDKYLKDGGTWHEARQRVHSPVYKKLKEWRDEADDDFELEETFREIIVLDDDDEDDTGSSNEDISDYRADSLEIISSHATARELQPENFARIPPPNMDTVSTVSRRRIYAQPVHHITRTNSSNNITHGPQQVHRAETYMWPLLPAAATMQPQPRHTTIHQSSRRSLMQDVNGQWYNLEPIPPSPREREILPRHIDSTYRDMGFTRGRSSAPQLLRRLSGDDVVLPSIEREIPPTSPGHHYSYTHQRRRIDEGGVSTMIPRAAPRAHPTYEVIDLTSSPQRTGNGTGYRPITLPAPGYHMRDQVYEERYLDPRRDWSRPNHY